MKVAQVGMDPGANAMLDHGQGDIRPSDRRRESPTMRHQTTIERTGPNTAGSPVSDEVLTALGGGRRPAVTVTVNRSTVGAMGGRSLIPLSSTHRSAAGVEGGETLDVEIGLDTAPRTVVVPENFATAPAAEPVALATFERLSNSDRSWHVLQVEGAKAPETRVRRIAKSVAMLGEGRGPPNTPRDIVTDDR